MAFLIGGSTKHKTWDKADLWQVLTMKVCRAPMPTGATARIPDSHQRQSVDCPLRHESGPFFA